MSFGRLCPGKCSIQLERNNKLRLTAFIPLHLSKNAIIFISAPYEACLSGSSQSLLSPGWASFISPFIKVTASFPCLYFLSRGEMWLRVFLQKIQRELNRDFEWCSTEYWVQRTRSGCRFYHNHTRSPDLNCNLNIYRGTRFQNLFLNVDAQNRTWSTFLGKKLFSMFLLTQLFFHWADSVVLFQIRCFHMLHLDTRHVTFAQRKQRRDLFLYNNPVLEVLHHLR